MDINQIGLVKLGPHETDKVKEALAGQGVIAVVNVTPTEVLQQVRAGVLPFVAAALVGAGVSYLVSKEKK